MTASTLTIQATTPPGSAVGFGLAGDSQTTRSGGSGAGGWQLVDRPRKAATTEWVDFGGFQMTISLIIDGYSDTPGTPPSSIEADCTTVESWELPAPGTSPPLPPILKVTGPVPHNEIDWVVQNLVWKEAIRDPSTGVRYQQNLDMVLWQYVPPTITVQATPAQAAQAGASGNTYTVKTGDTLQTIANTLYGSWTYWTLLANANGISDPKALSAGQILTVPAKTATPPTFNPGAAGAANVAAAAGAA